VQSTRARIIDLLRGGHTATVDDITRELVLAPATVRRHLDVLLRDGLVEMGAEKLPLGRPHFVFMLSIDGRDSLPEHQIRLTTTVMDELLSLKRGDTRRRSGGQIAELVFDRLAQRLIYEGRERVTGRTLQARLTQAVEALGDAGIELSLAPAANLTRSLIPLRPSSGEAFREESVRSGDYVIQGIGCPCYRLLSSQEGACWHNERVLTELVGAPVKPLAGHDRSDWRIFVVRDASEAGS
jgi:predicted ArsR family transcriptional regulator